MRKLKKIKKPIEKKIKKKKLCPCTKEFYTSMSPEEKKAYFDKRLENREKNGFKSNSGGLKKFYASMSPAKKKKFFDKIIEKKGKNGAKSSSEGLKKFYASMSPEVRKEFVDKKGKASTKTKKERGYKTDPKGLLKFFADMTPAQEKKFYAKRGKTLKKTNAKRSSESKKAQTTNARKVKAEIFATPEGKARLSAIFTKNLTHNSIVIRDLPRINDYAGNVTFSEYESL